MYFIFRIGKVIGTPRRCKTLSIITHAKMFQGFDRHIYDKHNTHYAIWDNANTYLGKQRYIYIYKSENRR